MALPSSGTLRLTQIQAEFGGSSPPGNLRAYLKGAGYVTTSDTAPNVPSSGTLTLRAFLGAAKASALSASISATSTGGVGTGSGIELVTSDPVTVTAAGGAGSYSYAWTKTSGTVLTVTASTSATTAFRKSLNVGGTASAVYRCTVTDAAAATAWVEVNVDLSN